ncbi:MAG: 4-hydroxy-3-methylbut-2-enyl diphosphate reductase [Treponema sp.]|nr:4-hydroxy-3-methylbut-2-enyl diphosphate reductase [Treponema sp.]
MKTIRARVSGFCMGVRRAVDMAIEAADRGGNVYTCGPLIHNTRVLDNLEKHGIMILGDGEVNSIPEGSSVVIRAHGIPPLDEKFLRDRGAKILDATCPHVKVSQKKAEQYAKNGYDVFLAGEKDHGEIIGIKGYAESALTGNPENTCMIVSNSAEAEAAAGTLSRQRPDAKTVLIGQTTISPGEYESIGESIRRFFPNLEIIGTICACTADRQNALRELCRITDAVIIAGSRESANTRRLLLLAQDLGKPCWLAESAAEIPAEIMKYETVGIAAGASAPEELIVEIENMLKFF